jgi:hypothetical protein
MGFKDWQQCAGLGLRKMGITSAMTYGDKNIAPLVMGMSRHKNYQTSLLYQKLSDDMYLNYNRAILGKHVKSPPKEGKLTKRPCNASNNIKQLEQLNDDEYNGLGHGANTYY